MRVEAFPNKESAAGAAAEAILGQLAGPGRRSMCVTGGSSPGPVYDQLCQADLAWSEITVTLSDDRFVDRNSELSNERLVRERLLRDRAASAHFVPLKSAGPAPKVDAARAEPTIRRLLPFDAVLLGMGEDGHIASLFPNAPRLATALDPSGRRLVIGVAKAGLAPYVPRISLTAAALFDAALIALLTSGAAKQSLLQRVETDPDFAPPVAALLRHKTPVRVIWSP